MQDWVAAFLNVIANFLSMLESVNFLGVPFLWVLVALSLVPVVLALVFRGL